VRPLVSEFALRDAEGDATEEVLTMPGRVYMLCVTAFDRLPRSCARRMARLAERAREEGALPDARSALRRHVARVRHGGGAVLQHRRLDDENHAPRR
jgi:hypothetical protein